MRRSDQPSRPSASTDCFLSSLKTLLIPAVNHDSHRLVNVSTPYSWWPVFRCPLVAGFGCPPRVAISLLFSAIAFTQPASATIRSVATKWLASAQKADWPAMAKLSQESWRRGTSDVEAAKQISYNYDFWAIKSWTITAIDQVASARAVVKATIETSRGRQYMTASLIKEGQLWRVNPTSALFSSTP